MSLQAEAVAARLDSTWSRWWLFSLGSGLALAGCVAVAALALFVLTDALLHLSQVGLGVLFVLWAGLSIAALAFVLDRRAAEPAGTSATARRIEIECPELGSHLINLVQFSERNGLADDPFRQAALEQAAAAVADFPFERTASRESRWRRFVLCMQTPRDLLESSALLVLVLALGYVGHASVPTWASSTRRVLHPWEFVPAWARSRS